VKKTMKAALAATLMLSAATTARADQTINGAVGLPLNPTAQIPLPNGVRVQANYFDLDKDGNTKLYGVYGAGRVGGSSLEINGGIEKLSSDFDAIDKSGIAIGAKYLFTRESDPVGVRIAAGAGYSRSLFKNVHAYVVGTKYFGDANTADGGRAPVIGHLGLRYDRFDSDDDSSRLSLYGGVEVPLTGDGDFSAVGELQTKNNDFKGSRVPFSASVRFRPGTGEDRPFSASLGVQRQGLFNDTRFFGQIGYSFDTAP
jgi:hypothetical protein